MRFSSARHLRWLLSLVAAGLCLLLSTSARAGWMGDLMGSRPVPFCPLVYGPACKISLSLDLGLAYQHDWSAGRTDELARLAGEVALLGRLGSSHVHLGAGIEVGGQAPDDSEAFHVTPRLRLRYFPARGPVTLELGTGPMYQRNWMNGVDGSAVNRFGISNELSVGVLGFASVVGGAEVLGSPGAATGTEVHAYVGGRLSLVSIVYLLVNR